MMSNNREKGKELKSVSERRHANQVAPYWSRTSHASLRGRAPGRYAVSAKALRQKRVW